MGLDSASDAWRHAPGYCLPKERASNVMTKMRLITMLAILQTNYLKILVLMMSLFVHFEIPQYSISGKSAADAIFSLRMLIEKANNWGLPLFLVRVDIVKAFDKILRAWINESMKRKGILGLLRAAIMRELLHTTLHPFLFREKVGAYTLKIGVRQGGPDGPVICVISVDEALVPVLKKWKDKGWGVMWPGLGVLINLLEFADDLFIAASSYSQAQEMVKDVQRALRTAGLEISMDPKKSCWLTTVEAYWKAEKLPIEGGELKQVDMMLVLGSLIARDGGCMADIQRRISLSWEAFKALEGVLKNGYLSIDNRLKVLDSYIENVLVYASETWTATVKDLKKLYYTYVTFATALFKVKKEPGETWIQYTMRRRRFAKEQLQERGHPGADEEVMKRYCHFAFRLVDKW